jgi:DNA helicase IV
MKLLSAQAPTPEQLKIISDRRPGVEIIRGAAGSGKTTTALLRLKILAEMYKARKMRLNQSDPVKILVLTFNRTLSGYVSALAQQQATAGGNVSLEVDTFSHWAWEKLGRPSVSTNRAPMIREILKKLPVALPIEFLDSEIEYVLGRFPASSLEEYLVKDRTGRGGSPRIDRNTKASILAIIKEYKTRMKENFDWDDISILMASQPSLAYDIAVIDEAQDFSANQIRAVIHHLKQDYALALIVDTMQRLYPRGCSWPEVGIDLRRARLHRLKNNYRNTIEIAQFVKGIIDDLAVDDDGTLPDLNNAQRHGPLPVVVRGKYGNQAEFAVEYIKESVDLSKESVAFLHPLGWFKALVPFLMKAGLEYDDITRERDWPEGPNNIALCTMHSAKGLEFDHVVIIGLNAEVTPHGPDADDHKRETLRRLLAMAVARARVSVIIGYKEEEASTLVEHFVVGTFTSIDL